MNKPLTLRQVCALVEEFAEADQLWAGLRQVDWFLSHIVIADDGLRFIGPACILENSDAITLTAQPPNKATNS